MKNKYLSFILALFFCASNVGVMIAQEYDDLYYDPDRDNTYTESYSSSTDYTEDYYDEDFDDDFYDYEYTSRIRRFHRPYRGFQLLRPDLC